MQHALSKLLVLWIAAASTACSVEPATFRIPVTIGGTITGLDGGGLTLINNGGDDLEITGNGAFAFRTPLARGASYALAVKRHPSSPTQMCSIANGTGTAGDADVTDVQVSCQTVAFEIGGTVTGLRGSGLVLQNGAGDVLPVSADGTFSFATPVLSGASYEVGVAMPPSQPTQACTVANGTGTVGASDVTDIAVTCATSSFTIGGTVTGLLGAGLVIQNNGADDLVVNAGGSFTFTTPIESGSTFEVTVQAQPALPTQTCTVSGGTGTVGGGDVTSVAINCTTNSYTIGGTISGLAGTVRLRNNGGNDLVLTANGTFAFSAPVLSGQMYAVTVAANPVSPISQTCMVTNGAGTVGGSDVTTVQVTCTTNSFTIGGTVSGLTGAGLVLRNNGGNDLPITGNGPFTFTTPVASGATYAVTVGTQPSGQTCTVAGGTGMVGAGNVTSVQVTCGNGDWSPSMFPIAVPGTGFALGDLALDGNGDLLVTANPAHAIVRVSRATGAQSTVVTGVGTGSFLMGVAYRAANDRIYTNTPDQIFEVTPAGTVTLLASVPTLNAIVIAPPSFGSFGGFIIGVTQSSTVAVNPANGAVTTIASSGAASDLAFAPDGTLYISGGPTVRTVTAAGVVTTFASGFGSADGITITPDGARMFITDSGSDLVHQVTIPGAVRTAFGAADIDDGFGVGGILAAPGNTLIVMTGETSLTLIAFPY